MAVYEGNLNVCPGCGNAETGTNPSGALPLGLYLNDTYRVGSFLSMDSEGVTYDAIDVTTRRPCLVKEYMPVTLCSGRSEALALLVRPGSEVPYKNNATDFVDLYTKLRHLNNDICLLSVQEVFYGNNTVYAVTEKAEGLTLTEYLDRKGGRLGWNEALDLLDPLWVAVERMHRAGVLHRGICCDNIFVTGPGVVRLGGYATQAMRSQGTELKAQLYHGFAAPEQYSAEAFDGAFTDIYAVCAVLYRVLTGHNVPSARERLNEDMLSDPTEYANRPLPDGSVQKLPIYLADAILHGLQLESNDRFEDMASFREALTGQRRGPAVRASSHTTQFHVQQVRQAAYEVSQERQKPKGFWAGLSIEFKVTVITVVSLLAVFAVVLGIWNAGKNNGTDPESDSGFSLADSSSAATESELTESETESVGDTQSEAESELVPGLVGVKYADARLQYQNIRFNVTYAYSSQYETGVIMEQKPESGTELTDNKMEIVVSQGAEPVPMPDLEGMQISNATQLLDGMGIKYTVVQVVNDGSYAEGIVILTEPGANTSVQPGVDNVVIRVASAKPAESSSTSAEPESSQPTPPESESNTESVTDSPAE